MRIPNHLNIPTYNTIASCVIGNMSKNKAVVNKLMQISLLQNKMLRLSELNLEFTEYIHTFQKKNGDLANIDKTLDRYIDDTLFQTKDLLVDVAALIAEEYEEVK